jgi:hypothetical protein
MDFMDRRPTAILLVKAAKELSLVLPKYLEDQGGTPELDY